MNSFDMVLKFKKKKESGIAFKAANKEVVSSDDEEDNNEEMKEFMKKFRRFLKFEKINEKSNSFKVFSKKKNGGFKKKVYFKKNDASKSDPHESRIKCYDCGARSHISLKCPNKNKKKKFIKKAMNYTWSDSKDEES